MIYPTSVREPLIARIKQLSKRGWVRKPKRLPDSDVFQQLVDVAFHASFLTEEKRRPGFRILFCSPRDLRPYEVHDGPGSRFRTISMRKHLPLTAAELNRIAPAADLTRFLICVHFEKANNRPYIWGLLDAGISWWNFIHHEAQGGKVPPNFLTITSTAPGELSFSVAGMILLVLKNGVLSRPSHSPIWSGPISDYLDSARQRLYEETLQELKTEKWDDNGHDDGYPHRFYNHFLERVLYNVRNLGHGGTLLLVPQEIAFDDPRLVDRIVLKYGTDHDHAWGSLVRSLVNSRRYYDLYFPLSEGKKRLTMDAFRKFTHARHEKDSINEEIQDVAKSVASLCSVDGAVVMTTQFKVLGFGGEIVAVSPALEVVTEVSDTENKMPIESFGTRHRSAFRFCSSFEDSVAFIVSADGGVKAVKRHGRELLFWADINEGVMGV